MQNILNNRVVFTEHNKVIKYLAQDRTAQLAVFVPSHISGKEKIAIKHALEHVIRIRTQVDNVKLNKVSIRKTIAAYIFREYAKTNDLVVAHDIVKEFICHIIVITDGDMEYARNAILADIIKKDLKAQRQLIKLLNEIDKEWGTK